MRKGWSFEANIFFPIFLPHKKLFQSRNIGVKLKQISFDSVSTKFIDQIDIYWKVFINFDFDNDINLKFKFRISW